MVKKSKKIPNKKGNKGAKAGKQGAMKPTKYQILEFPEGFACRS